MASLEETLAQGVTDEKIPHAVIFATNGDGSWTYSHAVGNPIHGSSGGATIAEDAEFMLASQTKLLTTIVVLQAVEKGLVTLDEDVGGRIPELSGMGILKGFDAEDIPVLEERKNPLTLRLLLTHSAGTPYDATVPDLLKYNQQRDPTWTPNTARTVVDRFAYPLLFEPGTSWTYGTAIDWAGKVVERLAGKGLEELVQDGIAEPLGLKTLTFFPYAEEKKHLGAKVPALTARMPDGKLMLHTEPFMNIDPVDAMGGHGAYASLAEYIRVLRSLLANDEKLLTKATVEMMFQPQLTRESVEALGTVMKTPVAQLFIGEWKPELDLDWGLGGILLKGDGDGRRKKGSLSWGGVANTFWLIDREADLAMTFGTQVLPPGDHLVREMISAMEFDLYKRKGIKF